MVLSFLLLLQAVCANEEATKKFAFGPFVVYLKLFSPKSGCKTCSSLCNRLRLLLNIKGINQCGSWEGVPIWPQTETNQTDFMFSH